MNQTDMILNHLMKYGSITPREADAEYGIMRLGARIYDLKRDGYTIRKTMVESENRFGDKVRFARYSLEGNGSDPETKVM